MSCLGGTNTGYLRVPASCEVGTLYDTDGTTILEENHFNSWNSRLWARVRSTFSVDLNNMYSTLRSNGLFTLENMLSYFEKVWEVIPPKMYNESQQIKYINDGATGMVALHGNRKLQIKKWLRERIAYLDSKFGYYAGGGTNEQYVNFRMNYQGNVSLDISTYYTVYAKVRWASKNEQVIRIAKGQKKTFSYYSDVGTDREVMIMLPESLKTIENISNIHPNSIDISKATKLTQIEAHNPNLFSVDLSKNKYLRKVDFNGCERLGTETATMTLNYCKYLNYVDLRNTKITAVTFNNKGGSLRKIYYPTTIQSINLMNQGLLTDMILPYGEDGSKAPVDLATINIENCPNINKLIDLSSDPTSLNGMKYCRNLTLNNSIKLTRFNFYGFTRLANVNLQNMDTLEEVDFLNMTEVGQQSSLRYIGVSACPKMATISMNVDNPNYEITWADQGILDLQTAGGVKNIYSNCIIKGLTTILLPVTIENMYFTNEYGSGYSDIENIWSPASATVSKTGVYPVAYHLDDNNEVDDFVGMDLKGSHLYNIDLGALVNIPEAINFSLYPTNTNPNFNKNRDGQTLPYLKPIGTLDLSNYTESLAKFFNGVDLDTLQLICTNILPQTDFSYCFYNSTFTTLEAINPVLEKMSMVSNASHMFDSTIIDNIDVLSNIAFLNGAIIDYMFANTRVTNIDGFSLKNNISSAEGLFDGCVLITSANNMNLNVKGKLNNFLRGAKVLATMNNLTLGTAVTSAEYFVANCPKLLSATNMKLNTRGSLAHFADKDGLLSTITGISIPNATNLSYMFNRCSNLSDYYDTIPSTCENFGYMYAYTAITEIDGFTANYNSVAMSNNNEIYDRVISIFEGCDLSRVDNFNWDYPTGWEDYGLFKDMSSLSYIYIITGTHCTNLNNMASGTAVSHCQIDGNSFNSINNTFNSISSRTIDLTIDVSNVINAQETFANSSVLSLDLTSWNTSKLQDMTSFLEGGKIQTFTMANCVLDNLKNLNKAFNGCNSLNSVNFSGCNLANITGTTATNMRGDVNLSNTILGTYTVKHPMSFANDFLNANCTSINLDSAVLGSLTLLKCLPFTNKPSLQLSVNGLDLTNFTDFTSMLENSYVGNADFNNVIFNINAKLIFDYAFKNSNVKSDILLPTKTGSCIECYYGCSSLIDAHKNWEQTYFYGITPTDCYKGCVNLTNIDGVSVVNEYSTGLDDVPTNWGGYGFFKWCTGIYKIDTTLLGQDAEENDILTVNLPSMPHTTYDNGVVNWGDGTVTDKTVYSHTYAKPGVYVIKTKRQPGGVGYGTCVDFQKCMTEILQYPTDFSPQGICYNCRNVVSARIENNIINSRNRSGSIHTIFRGSSKLKDVVLTFAEDVYPTGADGIFMACSSLETIDLSTLNTSRIERIADWFSGCTNLKTITGLRVTSYTKTLQGIFSNCPYLDLNGVEGISEWDVSGVTNFNNCFADCTYMTGWELIKNWDVSSAINIESMFSNSSLNDENFINISNWNLANVQNLHRTFYKTKIKNIDLSCFNLSNVNNMQETFRDSVVVESITLPELPSVTNVNAICSGCTALRSFDFLKIKGAITTIRQAFENCWKLADISGFAQWNVSNAKDFYKAFYACQKISGELDFSNMNWDSCTILGECFKGMGLITKVYLPVTNKVNNMNGTFQNCSNLTYINRLASEVNFNADTILMSTSIQEIGYLDLTHLVNTWAIIRGNKKLTTLAFKPNSIPYLRSDITGITELWVRSYGTNTDLTKNSLLSLLNGLMDLTGTDTPTCSITLSSYYMAKLTDDEISIATNKGWTIINGGN
ncbi:MAG: BspA family leucine-rich repeat surface protein [Clostridium sp.]|nr:BspA family leucine-rich repeat surface protein [Clostridium sp.]